MPGSAGTGMIRLNLSNLHELTNPIPFTSLVQSVAQKFKVHLQRVFDEGGVLSPKTMTATVAALIAFDNGLTSRFARFSADRAEVLALLSSKEKISLALQKDTLTLALQIGGIDTEEVLDWIPSADGPPQSFLSGLSGTVVREDAMIISDFNQLPGFEVVKDTNFGVKEFVSLQDPSSRLVVFMANRLPLEQQTGADLIYLNERHNSFVLVQYKAMNKESGEAVFRWKDNDQLAEEISRMDFLQVTLQSFPDDPSPASFRIAQNPFFLKICSRQVLNIDDKGIFPGMYFPLDLWKSLAVDKATLGRNGGRYLTYKNAYRRLTNSEFVMLVAGGWVGTTVPQSAALKRVISLVLETGRTVTFAIKRSNTDHAEAEPDADHDNIEVSF